MRITVKIFISNVLMAGICVLAAVSIVAAQKDLDTSKDASKCRGKEGVALVIGNSNYQNTTVLKSPVYDAEDMGELLRGFGFCVLDVRKDASKDEMEDAISDFEAELKATKKVGIFYYSGHGVQSKGINYLIPVDARIPSENFLEKKAIDLDDVLEAMEDNELNIVIIDACRNNPFEKTWRAKGDSATKGLANVAAPSGTLIAYATLPNRVALDGDKRNSPYTRILLTEMKKKGVNILQMFSNVRTLLSKETNKGQVPWEANSIIGDFCLGGCGENRNSSSSESRTETQTDSTSIPYGPNNQEMDSYLSGTSKTPVKLKTKIISENSDAAIREAASRLTEESKTHSWDKKWYYQIVSSQNEGLVLAWKNLKANLIGWLFVQRNKDNVWFYKSNDGVWKELKRGVEACDFWNIDSDVVRVCLEAPVLSNGWKPEHIKYKFSY